jgi:MFS transporter, DHA1 family, multidrug resistance protein
MRTKELKCLFLIIVIFIAACIETDIYLPAFTDMMTFFSISEEKVQRLLTWNFIGICLSSPFYGPLSDAYGRKKPLMVALSLFLLGSIMTLMAQSFDLMLWGRVLQGLGSGGCFTLGTAIIFDTFQEKKAIEAMNKINTIVPFLMAGAPVLGGYLNQMYGFRSNFLAIALFVCVSFFICLLFFEETLNLEGREPFKIKKILTDFKCVLKSLPFWQMILIISLLFAGYLTFLSGISVLFVMQLGVSKDHLPLYQVAILGAWLLANITSNRSIKKWKISGIKKIGSVLFVMGGVCLALTAFVSPENTYLLTASMMLYAFGVNWIQTVYFPEGMAIFPDIKGVTSSIVTSARLLITACVVGFAGYFYNDTIYPIVGVVCGVVVIIFTTVIFYERKRLKNDELPSTLTYSEQDLTMH